MALLVSDKVSGRIIVLGAANLLVMCAALQLFGQEPQSNVAITSEIKRIGAAEVKSVAPESLFDPSHQPDVYWHDAEWNIDLVRPSSDGVLSALSIRSVTGETSVVEFPSEFQQINSILRAPGDKAIVVEEDNTGTGGFAIVDLKTGALTDKVGTSVSFISPDRRFILYKNWFPSHAKSYENLYRLYDVKKTPKENVCGYRTNDPKHNDLDDGMRGFQVYPQRPGQTLCIDPEDDEDDNMATNFVWSSDSSKIIFADVKSGVMGLVLVIMPIGANDKPKTSVYALTGAEDVCAGATDAAGDKNCDYHIIQSLGWAGNSVHVVFHHRFGTNLDLEWTIPVSKFAPIGN